MITTLEFNLSNPAALGSSVFIPESVDANGVIWGDYTPAESPPNTLTLIPGDTVRFKVQFKYLGPATSYILHCALGRQYAGQFDEDSVLNKDFSKSVSKCETETTITTTADITIPANYGDYFPSRYGWKDAYCKITDPKLVSPIYIDAINIVSFEPTFSDIKINSFEKV